MVNQKPIVEVVKKFVVGFNRHDHEYLARLYTETADFVSVLGEHWTGMAELKAEFRKIHTTFLKNSEMTTDKVRIKILSSNTAIVHHSWKVLNGHDEARSYKGIITHVLVEADGRWKIESSHNSTIR
ncbi:MAG: SgcJ/EcaC family oxidoreductase [Planctomycetes bacterium]|nr:SgcJ/EcaC family oxidoreductase [Planctomycetota bacterium]